MFGRKAEIIRRVGQEKDPSALRTLLAELRERGWLFDGSLAGVNLSNADLSRVSLDGADLSKAALSEANLRRANLHHAVVDEADLSGSDLSEADLREATFENALLGRANLRGAVVRDEQLTLAEMLHGATMPDGRRYDGRFNLPRDLHAARQERAYPDQPARMSGWYGVSQADYERGQEWAAVNLPSARQAGFSFASADVDWLAEARAAGRLSDGSLRGEDLAGIILAGCELSRANLSGAILSGASFLRADLRFADLGRATLIRADLELADLSSALLRGADLSQASLLRADARGADFGGAALDGARLAWADLRGARLDQAQLARAASLRLATMPDAHPYEGRYRLPGDLAGAKEVGIDQNDAEQMAAWYEVSVREYLAGQKWAEANLGALLPEEG